MPRSLGSHANSTRTLTGLKHSSKYVCVEDVFKAKHGDKEKGLGRQLGVDHVSAIKLSSC